MVMEGDKTLGGEHTMEYTDVIICTPEVYKIINNVTPINLIEKGNISWKDNV